ncbi:IclR family transcriptional regulator [Hydrocarboniphaga sp.]|uniref:IclR family transcriptional regulator n=1 Tax=Hydrocarboniphaga sp. TaxID=2033016 RepID=UPI0026175C8B|nr:IclR family transcriptional regulator [Hydrocarboniphaga sp.]
MAVKRSHSGSRVLAVMEAIASHQPIGVRALARLLDQDKSAIQRAVMTLADGGWIRPTREPPVRWEVTARIVTVANAALGSSDLRRRARPLLEQVRDDTGETVLLVVPDLQNFVIADVVESRQVLRMVPQLGILVGTRNTATGRAVLPYMDTARQMALLGAEPDGPLLDSFEATRKHGYAVSDGEINPAATNIAAPIFELAGFPAGAIVVTAPRERLTPADHQAIGKMLIRVASELSRGTPRSS